MNCGVGSSLSPNQNASTSLRPMRRVGDLADLRSGQLIDERSHGRRRRRLRLAPAASAAARRTRGRSTAAAMPRCQRMAAASAIMAPLSVHSASSGKWTRTPRFGHSRLQARAQRRIGTDAAGDDEPIAARSRRAPPSTCAPARRRSPPASSRARGRRAPARSVESSRAAWVRTAVFRPANEKSSDRAGSSGRGKRVGLGSPNSASRASAGPPG